MKQTTHIRPIPASGGRFVTVTVDDEAAALLQAAGSIAVEEYRFTVDALVVQALYKWGQVTLLPIRDDFEARLVLDNRG